MNNLTINKFLLILFILSCCLTAYSFMAGSDFKTLDDEVSIVNNADIRSLANAGKIFRQTFWNAQTYYRPLVDLSFMIDYHFFGLNPFYFSLTNRILHLCVVLTIFFLIDVIFKKQTIAFFVSLLYALHPIHWEAVSNIAGRSIILCGLFYLIAFLFFLKFCAQGRGRRKAVYYVVSLLSFVLALLSKESAVTLPLILLLSYIVFWKKGGEPFLKFSLKVLPFFCVLFCYLLIRRSLGAAILPYWFSFHEMMFGLLAAFRALFIYLKILIVPVGLYFDRSLPIFVKPYHPEILLAFGFFVTLFYALIRCRQQISKVALFFITWFFVTLLPEANIFPLRTQPGWISTMEHFLYIPSLGVFVLLVLIFEEAYHKARSFQWVSTKTFYFFVAGLYVFLFMMTVQNNIYASQEISMLKNSLAYNPNNGRVQGCLGLAYAKKRSFVEAEGHFQKAILINPTDVRARISFGKALCDQGRFEEGLAEYERISDAGSFKQLLDENKRLTREILKKKNQTP